MTGHQSLFSLFPTLTAFISLIVFSPQSSHGLECYECWYSPSELLQGKTGNTIGCLDPAANKMPTKTCPTMCMEMTHEFDLGYPAIPPFEIFYRNCPDAKKTPEVGCEDLDGKSVHLTDLPFAEIVSEALAGRQQTDPMAFLIKAKNCYCSNKDICNENKEPGVIIPEKGVQCYDCWYTPNVELEDLEGSNAGCLDPAANNIPTKVCPSVCLEMYTKFDAELEVGPRLPSPTEAYFRGCAAKAYPTQNDVCTTTRNKEISIMDLPVASLFVSSYIRRDRKTKEPNPKRQIDLKADVIINNDCGCNSDSCNTNNTLGASGGGTDNRENNSNSFAYPLTPLVFFIIYIFSSQIIPSI